MLGFEGVSSLGGVTVGEEEWEEELAKELEDLGLAGEGEGEGGGADPVADKQWEDELKHMLETHSTDST